MTLNIKSRGGLDSQQDIFHLKIGQDHVQVKQKVLSAHQILKGLAAQRKRRQYIPLLLVDQGALPDYRALRMCTQAEDNHEDFLEVLMHKQFINAEQCKMIRATWMRSGPPLGQILVELGLMNEETLADVLEEFEEEKALLAIDALWVFVGFICLAATRRIRRGESSPQVPTQPTNS